MNRDVLTSQDGKKKSAPAEMFGVDDLSDHGGSTIVHLTNNPGAYHLRMISYRSTLTNRTGLGRNEGEVSAVHLHWDPVFLTGKFDPILHRTDSLVNDLLVNLPVVNSWTSLPVIEGTGRESPTKSTEPDRTGPDRTGCQSPDESTGHGTGSDRTELGVNLKTSPPVMGQSSYLPVKGR